MLKFLDLHEDELLDLDNTDETNHIPQRACITACMPKQY